MRRLSGQHRHRVTIIATAILSLATLCIAAPAHAYKPEDPEVVAIVDKAIGYLERLTEEQIRATPYGGGDGQIFLVAYTHFKYVHDENSKVVKLGLDNATTFIANIKKDGGKFQPTAKTIYELSMALLLLAEVKPIERAADLQFLADTLYNLQKPHAGFGYPTLPTGDISMVQYVALASWTLDHAGVKLSLDRVNRLLGWTMRVQDVSGVWPYQGEDPGPGRGLIAQPREEMSVQMGLAGGSAVLILSDVFRIWDNAVGGSRLEGLPKALKQVDKSEVVAERRKKSPVKQEEVIAALRRMDSFRDRNPFKRDSKHDWYYYYLYTLERYESFNELATGRATSNAWYDQNVDELRRVQDGSGGWAIKDSSVVGAPVSTCLAILFLIRSTQKAIASISKGTMAGGYSLPSNTAEVQIKGTQVVKQPVATAVTDLLDLLEGDGADKIEDKSIPEDLKLETEPAARAAQLDRLMRLVRGSQSWQARRVAARLLGSSDELKVVPALIFALSDGDKLVRAYAQDGLTFIGRKFTSEVDLSEVDPKSAAVSQAQKQWTQWYRTIVPDYVSQDEF